jgi:hypothetical protein
LKAKPHKSLGAKFMFRQAIIVTITGSDDLKKVENFYLKLEVQ